MLWVLGRGCVARGNLAGGKAALRNALKILAAVCGPDARQTAELRGELAALDGGTLVAIPPTWK